MSSKRSFSSPHGERIYQISSNLCIEKDALTEGLLVFDEAIKESIFELYGN